MQKKNIELVKTFLRKSGMSGRELLETAHMLCRCSTCDHYDDGWCNVFGMDHMSGEYSCNQWEVINGTFNG